MANQKPPSINAGAKVKYSAGMSGVVVDAGLTVTSVPFLQDATVTITGGYIEGDSLSVNLGSSNLSYTITMAGNAVILLITGIASAKVYEKVLRTAMYSFSGADPTENGTDTVRTIEYQCQNVLGVHSQMASSYVDIPKSAICHLRGVRILTPTGEVPIETLKIGDVIVTRYSGMQPIKWIGRQSFGPALLADTAERLPVRISAGALGPNLPARDLYVSPGHSVLIDNTLVLAKTLINGITVTQPGCQHPIDYFQIDLGMHDCIIAEGTWSESFADGPNCTLHGLRGEFDNVAEFYALYPDHKPAETLVLCAPRPAEGHALAQVLAPIVARAASIVTPGPLEGYVDQVAGGWHIHGWAQDTTHPELPVELAVFLEGRQLGTIIACDWRDDLEKAGKARGRCAFRFTLPRCLRRDELINLCIVRAADGAMLPFTEIMLSAQLERLVA